MSSINPHYTFQYSQPEEYRFSHDSVFLARRVFELERNHINRELRVLDLCAGCGIIGLDFLFHCQKELCLTPVQCDFLEIQSVYDEHFRINQSRLQNSVTKMQFIKQNYAQTHASQYDLILCNPPYFNPAEGQLSPNEFKNRCRFFLDANQDELLTAISNLLTPTGRAYVLSRKINLVEPLTLKNETIGDIRGTPLVRFTKLKTNIHTRKESNDSVMVEVE